MAKSNPYHTDSLEYRPEHWTVYHDHDNCPEGKKILEIHREYGTGGKRTLQGVHQPRLRQPFSENHFPLWAGRFIRVKNVPNPPNAEDRKPMGEAYS